MAEPILENLHQRPKASDIYLWCDYAELRCLAHVDHKFSRGALLETIEESADIAPHDDPSLDELEDASLDEEGGDELFEAGDGPVAAALPVPDKNEARVADIYRNLAYRVTLFGDGYPFELDDEGQELRLKAVHNALQELYLQLLLSSSLRLVPKKRRHELTEPFEELSKTIFSCLMPAPWEVHRFGAKGTTRYTGNLFTRLTKLSEDLRGTLNHSEEHYHARNVGDSGLDIVAWHPMGNDDRIGIPIALAQCGCTAEEWSLKTLEASPSGPLAAALNTHHPWATYYFMPQDLVAGGAAKRDWQCRPKLTKTVVVDRYRLMKLAEQYGVAENCLSVSEQILEATALEVV